MTERVVIAGAPSGLGEETGYRFARAGEPIVLASRGDRLRRVAGNVEPAGGTAHVAGADLANDENAPAAVANAALALGGIDVLVNDPGDGLHGPSESVPRRDLEHLFADGATAENELAPSPRSILPGDKA